MNLLETLSEKTDVELDNLKEQYLKEAYPI